MGYQPPPIPRNGQVETVNAKLLARFGKVSDSYVGMLLGKPIPPNVLAMAEKFKRERRWEQIEPHKEQEMDRPEPPTSAEVSLAIDNLRKACVHAEKTYGPKTSAELIKLAKWLIYLNREYEKTKHVDP